MRLRFKVAARADRHIRTAASWWARNRLSAPMMLVEDLESAFALIEEFPHAGEGVPHRRIANLRRLLLSRVDYHLYYVVLLEEQVVEVLALWHTSRGTKPRI